MKILIVSATKFEVFPLTKRLTKVSGKDNLWTYRSGRHSLDVLITGVGMTATAFYLGKNLGKKYDLAINAGVAGSFRKNIQPGTVVNVVSDRFADLGAEDGGRFLTLKQLGLGEIVHGSKFKVQSLKKGHRLSVIAQLPKVKSITVNTVHGNTASIKKVIKKFSPDVESMEGAAFFYACNYEKIPCIQIRTISNYVERRSKKKWKTNLAVKNLNVFLECFLKEYLH